MGKITTFLLISLWVSLVSLVIFAITKQNTFFKDMQMPIAKLLESSDGILTRGETVVRWQKSVENQSLYDGDWVATGPLSTTKITLSSGQTLEIGEDSQIQVRAIMLQNDRNSFLVSLMRGSVFADLKSDCKKCPSITIKSNEKSFNVAHGESLGIVKEIGKPLQKISTKAALPIYKGKRTGSLGFVDNNFEITVVKPVIDSYKSATSTGTESKTSTSDASSVTTTPPKTESPSPLPVRKPVKISIPRISLRQYIVKIQADPTNKIMYTTDQKIDAIKYLKIKITMILPYIPIQPRRLIPGVRIYSDSNKTGTMLEALPGESFILIPIGTISSIGSQTQIGYIKDYRIKLMPGLRLDGDPKDASNFKGDEVELTMRSLGDWNKDQVELALDQLKSENDFANPWTPNKNLLSREQAPYRVSIYKASDIVKLRSLIRGSGSLGVFPVQSQSLEGLYIVKDRKILGEIAGTQINEGFFKVITHALGAETIFKGRREAFFEQIDNNLNNSIGKMLDDGKTIYVLKKGKTYPVSREFVKSNAEVAGFVDSQAKAIFLEKVDIIYSL